MHQFECSAIDLQRRLHNHSSERASDREIVAVTWTDRLHGNTTESAGRAEAITVDQIHHPAAAEQREVNKNVDAYANTCS